MIDTTKERAMKIPMLVALLVIAMLAGFGLIFLVL